MDGGFNNIEDFLNENEIDILPITFPHIQRLLQLELHHRDPFDRMIISQALTEDLTLATKDNIFEKYGVDIMW